MSKRGRGSDKRSSRQPKRNMFRVSACNENLSEALNGMAGYVDATSASNTTNFVTTLRQQTRREDDVENELGGMRESTEFTDLWKKLESDSAGILIVTVCGTNEKTCNFTLFNSDVRNNHAFLSLPGVATYRYTETGPTVIPYTDYFVEQERESAFLTGTGEGTNIIAELIVNVVRCIKHKNPAWPKRIYLDGWSRGAIAQALAAKLLEQEYPDIPLVLNLNDPVEAAITQTSTAGARRKYTPVANYRLGANVKIARINYAGSESHKTLRAVAINANGDAPGHFTFAANTLVVASHFALDHSGIISNQELLGWSGKLLAATINSSDEKKNEIWSEIGTSSWWAHHRHSSDGAQNDMWYEPELRSCFREKVCAARNYGVGTWDYLQEPHEQYEKDPELLRSYQVLKEDMEWRIKLGLTDDIPLPERVITKFIPEPTPEPIEDPINQDIRELYLLSQTSMSDNSSSPRSKATAAGINIHKELALAVFNGQAPVGAHRNSSAGQVFAPIAAGEYYSCTPLPICCRAVAEKMQNSPLTQVLFTHLLFGVDDSKPANFWGLIVFCGHGAERHCFVISKFLQLPPVAECIEDSFGSVSFLQSREYRGKDLVLFVQTEIFNALAKARPITDIEGLKNIIRSATTRITQANEERPDAASVATAPPRRRRGLFSGLFRRRGGRHQRQRDQAETSESKTDGNHPL